MWEIIEKYFKLKFEYKIKKLKQKMCSHDFEDIEGRMICTYCGILENNLKRKHAHKFELIRESTVYAGTKEQNPNDLPLGVRYTYMCTDKSCLKTKVINSWENNE